MILSALLKNFKCYKGINILPFSDDEPNYLNLIIGNNGVGKSAILEGLDTLFNDAHWIVNNDSKSKEDSQVGALFLLEKNRVNLILDSKEKNILEEISTFFWNFNPASMLPYRGYESFFETIKTHKRFEDENYLVFIGKSYTNKLLNFLTFDKQVKNSITTDPKPSDGALHKLLHSILEFHAYIYIPVETTVSNFVRLQNMSMQMLMDKNIKDEISKKLNEKRISRNHGPKVKKLSLLDMINEILEAYVNTVEGDIQKEYEGYSYKPAPRQSSKLKASHVSDTIIEAYYSKRIFKKDEKLIEDLSSGEKRIILIDIISAFIQKNSPSRELIVAIDEPESSLHISKCYAQFSKISKIALEYNHQIFVTTHWYGSLPILKNGGLIHIDDLNKATYSSLNNYFEKRGDLPNDIQLKGYFDLTSSLLYAFRNSLQTMVIVEGYEDKRYIEYYLSSLKLNIIPVGGCSNVKKIFSYLWTPLSDREMSTKGDKRKIICLIDTDISCPTIGMEEDIKSNILVMRRLHQEEELTACLIRCTDNKKNPTEVEDVLEPSLFYQSLQKIIQERGTEQEKDVFSHYIFNNGVKNSRIKGDYSILKQNVLGRNVAEDKKVISSFVDNNKDLIAVEYTSNPFSGNIPKWIEDLRFLCEKTVG